MEKRKRRRENSILRAVFVGVSLLFQIGWILLSVFRLNAHSAWISAFTGVLCAAVVLRLYSKHTTAAMKMPWIMLILVFPVMGLCLYLLIVIFGDLGQTGKRLQAAVKKTARLCPQPENVLDNMSPADANQCRYLLENAHSPAYNNTNVKFYQEATEAFDALKEALEQAESFIFMEYFIVEDGSSFRELREILERKVAAGVDVRLLYDDVGSIGYVNFRFARELNRSGIRCQVFNPALPVLNLFMNHRDHRKQAVIDGKVGFTGGYNLADEYFDRVRPYGKWKDTGLRLEGEAVRGLTAAFLDMWCAVTREDVAYENYLDAAVPVGNNGGFVQPYCDDPLGEERIAENVFLNLAARTERYLYFTTPYLIVTDEMIRALGLAAKRGVDVRIITPGVPDKKLVFRMTRSYYPELVRQGVRIYEYSPGFCHAKQCVCDGKLAQVGTSNLDYRSLYLHYENNVLFGNCDAVAQVTRDFEELFPQCEEVTEKYSTGRNAVLRIWQCMLRLFAPLV